MDAVPSIDSPNPSVASVSRNWLVRELLWKPMAATHGDESMATNRQRACSKALSSLLCLLLAPACTSGVAPDSMSAVNAGASSSASAGAGSSANAEGGSGGNHEGSSGAASMDCTSPDASRVKFRVLTRLNRVEYDNTARDLL